MNVKVRKIFYYVVYEFWEMSGKIFPCIIGGEPIYPKNVETLKDLNPADVTDIVAEFPKLGREEVSRAIEQAE